MFTIGRQIGIDTMIGLAMMAVIVTGGLDLSVGAIGVCAAMTFGWLVERQGIPLVVVDPGRHPVRGALGWINGTVVVRSGVHSFIITLASMSIFFGVMIFFTRAEAFRGLPPEIAGFRPAEVRAGVQPAAGVARDLRRAGGALPVHDARPPHAGRGRQSARRGGLGCADRPHLHRLPHADRRARRPRRADGDLPRRRRSAEPGGPARSGLAAAGLPRAGARRHLALWREVAVIGTLLGAAFADIITAGLLQLRVGEFWIQAFLGLMLLAAVLADRGRHLSWGHGPVRPRL